MSRLTIDLSDQQHRSLTARAASQGKTLTQYALERLFPSDLDSDRAWFTLQALLVKRIDEGLSGHVSAKSIGEILDAEMTQDQA